MAIACARATPSSSVDFEAGDGEMHHRPDESLGRRRGCVKCGFTSRLLAGATVLLFTAAQAECRTGYGRVKRCGARVARGSAARFLLQPTVFKVRKVTRWKSDCHATAILRAQI